MAILVSLFLATLLSTSHAQSDFDDNPIRMLRQPRYGNLGRDPLKINCQSFRVGVEANNLRDWETVPSYCKSYIKQYLTSKQYNLDIEAITIEAIKFARSTPLPFDLRPNVWVFDLDDTLLSNLDFFNTSDVQFGTLPFNDTELYEWVKSGNGTAPALPAVKYLYDAVLVLGYQTVIISEAPESIRAVRTSHLKKAGYFGWNDLIFRGKDDNELSSKEFKTKKVRELVLDKRYRIISTIGDQWSDLTIPHAGRRTFKVPNPVYYRE